MPISCQIGTREAREIYARAICARLGRGRAISYAEAESMTGIPRRTLKSYGLGTCMPSSMAAHFALTRYLGAEFTNALLHPLGQGGAVDLNGNGDVNPLTLNAAAAALTALIAEHAANGVISHQDILAEYDSVSRVHAECGEWLRKYAHLRRSHIPASRVGAA